MKPTILAIVGPTGAGKTSTAIELCKELNAEIVSMDSMQIYRGMDIGTAKPTKEELSLAVHHMIDVADPTQLFTVSMYREMACGVIEDILARGKLPILVGGTGLYLDAISYEMRLGEKGADQTLRDRLHALADEKGGAEKLHAMLASVDPASAKKLHPNDVRRVIRALEIYETSGKTKSEQAVQERTEGPYHLLVYGLSLPREQMYDRINKRVDEMISAGLIHEVKGLLDSGVKQMPEGGAMQAIGYKEIISALHGEYSMERAVDLIKQNSRRYAKRQWTWFRRDPRTKWFDWSEYVNPTSLIDDLIQTIRNDLK